MRLDTNTWVYSKRECVDADLKFVGSSAGAEVGTLKIPYSEIYQGYAEHPRLLANRNH